MAYIEGNNNQNKLGEVSDNQRSDALTTPLDTLVISSLKSKTIDKTFGREDDYIELHIYNNNNQLIHSEMNLYFRPNVIDDDFI